MASMDVLKALDELKDAGVEERSARAMIRMVSEAVETQAATKADIERECGSIRASLTQSTTELRSEMVQLGSELRSEMAQLGSELRGEISTLRDGQNGLRDEVTDLRGGLGGLRDEIVELRNRTGQDFASLRVEMLRESSGQRDNLNARLLTTVGLQFGGTALLLGAFYALLR